MSKECLKTELDLFRAPMTQTSIEHSYYIEVPPLTALTETSPIEFHVAASNDDYLDLNNTYLFSRVKITRANGANLLPADDVGFINYPANTIFSQLDITLGDRLISTSSSTYPYRCILECLMNYGKNALDRQFGNGLFVMDTAGHMNETATAGGNAGLRIRAEYTGNSRIVELVSPIHGDIFFQDRLILNGVDLKLKFTRAKNEFCLMYGGQEEFKLHIESASLFVKKVCVAPPIRLAHAKALMHSNALYPVQRATIKTFSINAGTRVASFDHAILGKLPTHIVLALVNDIAFNGAATLNPFHFHHYDIEFLCLYIDGVQLPAKPYQSRLTNGGGARELVNMYQSSGNFLKDVGMAIGRQQFINGYTLYCFNLNADEAVGGHMSLAKTGNARIELRFSRALPHTVNLVCYSVEDSVIEISSRRQVLTDF